MKALQTVYPDIVFEEEENRGSRFNYPRPISEPPSPSSSRHSSIYGSEDEDEVDEEKEVCGRVCDQLAAIVTRIGSGTWMSRNRIVKKFELSNGSRYSS